MRRGICSASRRHGTWVKISRALVAGCDQDAGRRAAIAAIVGLARDRGLPVIAEGSERPEEAEAVREAGIQYGQGFLFARPVLQVRTRIA